jgi:septin family protein
MVAGGRGTGKTSLIKLFLDTSDFSSSATLEQKASVAAFLSKSRKGTRAIQKASVEITEVHYDRMLLTLIDTPGLRFGEGEELALERSVYAHSCVSSICTDS